MSITPPEPGQHSSCSREYMPDLTHMFLDRMSGVYVQNRSLTGIHSCQMIMFHSYLLWTRECGISRKKHSGSRAGLSFVPNHLCLTQPNDEIICNFISDSATHKYIFTTILELQHVYSFLLRVLMKSFSSLCRINSYLRAWDIFMNRESFPVSEKKVTYLWFIESWSTSFWKCL